MGTANHVSKKRNINFRRWGMIPAIALNRLVKLIFRARDFGTPTLVTSADAR
jgi:hypothetical protein